MKKLIGLALIISFAVLSSASFAHSGGTNSEGCHTKKNTGEYHCHSKK